MPTPFDCCVESLLPEILSAICSRLRPLPLRESIPMCGDIIRTVMKNSAICRELEVEQIPIALLRIADSATELNLSQYIAKKKRECEALEQLAVLGIERTKAVNSTRPITTELLLSLLEELVVENQLSGFGKLLLLGQAFDEAAKQIGLSEVEAKNLLFEFHQLIDTEIAARRSLIEVFETGGEDLALTHALGESEFMSRTVMPGCQFDDKDNLMNFLTYIGTSKGLTRLQVKCLTAARKAFERCDAAPDDRRYVVGMFNQLTQLLLRKKPDWNVVRKLVNFLCQAEPSLEPLLVSLLPSR